MWPKANGISSDILESEQIVSCTKYFKRNISKTKTFDSNLFFLRRDVFEVIHEYCNIAKCNFMQDTLTLASPIQDWLLFPSFCVECSQSDPSTLRPPKTIPKYPGPGRCWAGPKALDGRPKIWCQGTGQPHCAGLHQSVCWPAQHNPMCCLLPP